MSESIENHMQEMLVILSGVVPTPERGYAKDGGLSQIQADVRQLVKMQNQVDPIRAALPVTEDGKAVYPGCHVYWCESNGKLRCRTVHAVTRKCWQDSSGGQPHNIRDGSTPYFSTEKLAKQWFANKLSAAAAKAAREAESYT